MRGRSIERDRGKKRRQKRGDGGELGERTGERNGGKEWREGTRKINNISHSEKNKR